MNGKDEDTEDFSDDERPGSVINDSSIRAYGKSSISSIKTFYRGNKDTVVIIVLLAIVLALGFALARMEKYEERYNEVAKELSRQDILMRNHSDEATKQIEVAKILVNKLETRCRP